MNTQEMKITSLDQYIDQLHNTTQKGLFTFRGQINSNWEAIPSLLRRPRLEAIRFQSVMMRELLLQPHKIPYLRNQDPVEYMMLLQHFGIPTKLLDVTMDPLIALFFACFDPKNQEAESDGKVYMFYLDQYKKVKINTSELDVYKQGITTDNYKELLIDRIEKDEHLFFEPLIKNPRMRAQDGAFFMFTTCTAEGGDTCLSMEGFHTELNKYRKSQKNDNLLFYMHNIIDAKHKKNILNELDFKFGINESLVYIESDLMKSVESFFHDLKNNAVRYYEETLIHKHSNPINIKEA